MSIITENQIECIHIQVRSITRHFSSNFFADEASAKIYKLIRKITCVRQLRQLTATQYNIIMHHLRRLERAAYLHYYKISFLDQSMLQQMLEFNVIMNTDQYKRDDFSLEILEKAQRKAKSLINYDQLFNIE